MVRILRYNPNRYDRQEMSRRRDHFVVRGYKNWIDPFPTVIGTVPEKMIYEQLVRRSIPFWFQNEVAFNIPEIAFSKDYRPDIVLPTLKIIIEVQGSYWHSKPKAIEDDAFKFAVYEATGWKVLAWWDYDIIYDVNKLFRDEPLLSSYHYTGNNVSTEATNGRKVIRDDTKGIKTMNYNRAQRNSYRKKPVTIKKVKVKGLKIYASSIF